MSKPAVKLCGLWMAAVTACVQSPSNDTATDTDSPADDTPPPMTAWVAEAFPETRSCTVSVANGAPLSAGRWRLYDAEGWPIAWIIPFDGGMYVTKEVWNADHTMVTQHEYMATGDVLTTEDVIDDVYRFDEAGRMVGFVGFDDEPHTNTFDALGRMTSWDFLQASYGTNGEQFDLQVAPCVAEFTSMASVTTCSGTDTQCDYPADGGEPTCTEGALTRQVVSLFDADGYLASTDTVTTHPDFAHPETQVTFEENETITWSHKHTTALRYIAEDYWFEYVFVSAERARAWFDTIEPSYREQDGMLTKTYPNGDYAYVGPEDCDLKRVPKVPQAMADALSR